MAFTSLHCLAFVSPFLHGAESSFVAWLDWVIFLLHGGAVSAWMNECLLAISCEFVLFCLAGSLVVHDLLL
jgi:hypothetical protein